MSEIEHVLLSGFWCNGRGCDAKWQAEPQPKFDVWDLYMDAAEKDGWTFWVSRSRHSYCPAHGPSAKSSLRQVHPNPDRVTRAKWRHTTDEPAGVTR